MLVNEITNYSIWLECRQLS